MHNKKRITLISTGQPSSNPRLVKEATALTGAGYETVVIYCFWADWAQKQDKQILETAQWKAIQVGGSPDRNRWKWWYTRLRGKIARWKANSPTNTYRSFARAYDELLVAAIKNHADLYIAHNLGALPIVAQAAKKLGVLYAFDAEDFHRSESEDVGTLSKKIVIIEDEFLPHATFLSAASPMIAEAYQKLYPEQLVFTVNNVFRKAQQPIYRNLPINPLKLIWFSQTIGLNRGIQDVLRAMQLLKSIPIVLTLVGKVQSSVEKELRSFLHFPSHQIFFVEPVSEDELFELSAQHHIGLALERTTPLNRDICLTNKLFTYLMAGNAIIASNTSAQKAFMAQYPSVGSVYAIGEIEGLANCIFRYFGEPGTLDVSRRSAWELAQKKLNWETEKQKWLSLVKTRLFNP